MDNISKKTAVLTNEERNLVRQIEELRQEMDTEYRKECIRLADFGVRDYQGISNDRYSNLDMLNIPFSYSIINHRLSTLWANPSQADFKTIDENKQNNIEIYKQVNQYDKEISNYISTYQDIERTAHIEGSCWFGVDWEEILTPEGYCIGVPCTRIQKIRLNDFYWDASARTPREMNHGLRRMVMSRAQFERMFAGLEGTEGYKNLNNVPYYGEESIDACFDEKWVDNGGKKVTIWHFESRAFLENGRLCKKKVLIANGVPIYESDDLTIPPVNNFDILPWSKIDCIPTGSMIGKGIPVVIRHPVEAFSRLLTLTVAQAELNTSPPIFLRAGASNAPSDYPLMPGVTIPVRGSGKSIAEDYQVMQLPDISQGAQKVMADLIEYIIMITGVDIKALFVPASEKAITTENKRQIQEKLLRFTILHNEENGFKDMELMRMSLIQKNYPRTRTFLERRFGEETEREGYIQVPIKDHEIEESSKKGKKLHKLNFKEGAFTKLDINEDHIQVDIDMVIVGATSKSEEDAIKKRTYLENLQVIMSIPPFAEKLAKNPDKSFKYTLKQAGIPEVDFIEKESIPSDKVHPALKEIAAIQMADILERQGFKVPDDIPEPEEYDPQAYVDIFDEYVRNNMTKNFNVRSRKLFEDRHMFHQEKAMNPYFVELRKKEEEEKKAAEAQQIAGEMQQGVQATGNVPVPKQEEDSLMAQTRSRAAQIASQSR